MNGAESLVATLVRGGVEVCFANPGTSEMHFVAALDRVPGMRCVLGLFEGVVTGAADGYARMADKPAATLLHLGPGLSNGSANIHNARRALSSMINIVGDHATYHRACDAPLTSDIEGLARPVSHWVKTSPSAKTVAQDGADAIAVARRPPGQIATLILPADTAWEEADGLGKVPEVKPPAPVSDAAIDEAARILRSGEPTVLLMTGQALRDPALFQAGRIAAACSARLVAQTSNGRWERGRGRVNPEHLPYPVDEALRSLAEVSHVILVGAKSPVAFFAYPGKPSQLISEDCQVHQLARADEDITGALTELANLLKAPPQPVIEQRTEAPGLGRGDFGVENLSRTIATLLPEQAIVVDEALTSGRMMLGLTRGSAPHDWLQICGGAIGIGMPLAAGAAVACPDRRVVGLQADGSAMYTVQGLWTQARENLNVTTVVFANRSYQCLHTELAAVRAGTPGTLALDMLNLDRPDLDWVQLAAGMGVPGMAVDDMDAFNGVFADALTHRGPFLIQVNI